MDPLYLTYTYPSPYSTRHFGSSVGTPNLSEKGIRAFPGWVTHWEVLLENKTVRAWSGPKVDNIVLRRSRVWDVVEPGSGCDNFVSESIPDRKCANEDIPHRPGEWIIYALYVHTHLHIAQGLLGVYWLRSFWELTGFKFRRNSEVKQERGHSIPRMGDPLGSSTRMSSQKQNRKGVVRVQVGQYRATAESSPDQDVTIP
ncbi:hypothetical protein DVH24_025140 [Malus domestica]|uniref:Uncharacterized protein n=1 Tax=Malus domestica TaxID=3750 RepID=A0A498HL50_MALDO|nr:hypothetical protein DVH24_025140 [Malus domestica]